MPELPEVETIARNLRPRLNGRAIISARLFWSRSAAFPAAEELTRRLSGLRIEEVGRRAKYLRLRLSSGWLYIHLRMSGDLFLRPSAEPAQKHDRAHLLLEDGQTLVFSDPRKFGRLWLLEDPDSLEGPLGPEPLEDDFSPEKLYTALRDARRMLKPLLLDQHFLAGLGNIYTDESLHRAGLHPARPANSLSQPEAERLFHAIRASLQSGIEHNGASIDWVYRGGGFQNYFRVYQRSGQPCPVCGTLIKRIVLGQRGTHFCPVCQVSN